MLKRALRDVSIWAIDADVVVGQPQAYCRNRMGNVALTEHEASVQADIDNSQYMRTAKKAREIMHTTTTCFQEFFCLQQRRVFAIRLFFALFECWSMTLATANAGDIGRQIRMHIPLDNRQTTDKEELGKLLFHDKNLSADGAVSCSSCHDPNRFFSVPDSVSQGVYGRRTFRNAPSLLNVAFFPELMWDGRVVGLEAQAIYPITGKDEMGASIPLLLRRLSSDQIYREKFGKAFGDQEITIDRVVKALASYERTLVSLESAFERYYVYRINDAISEPAKKGWMLFKKHCLSCHAYEIRSPFFSDFRYYNMGIGFDKSSKDMGRYYYSFNPGDRGRFRTPSLRNVVYTAPYMHDGRFATLSEVIDSYRRGAIENIVSNIERNGINITDSEKEDLLAFLETI